tara:strand:+ start:155 stop:853 length:699 start_codon:yes stop_codon:yes gene_type:complete
MLFKNAFKKLIELKLFLIPIILFFWISSIFEHFLVKKIEGVVNSSDPSTATLIGYASLHLLNGIIFPTLITLLALSYLRNKKNGSPQYQIEGSPSNQLFIETLRSWGKTTWWFLALILPGLYKFISYSYVPIIVYLDPEYDKGAVDALEASEASFRKNWLATCFVFVAFYLVFPIMLSSILDSYKDFNETPMLALLVSVFNGSLSLFAFLLLAEIYIRDNTQLMGTVSVNPV